MEKRLEDDASDSATLGNVQPICPASPRSQPLLSQSANHQGEIVQASVVEPGDRAAIDWTPIELAVTGGLSFSDAAERFGVKQDSIRKRAKRHNWILPKGLSKIVHNKLEKAVEKVADDWLAKAETHRKDAFELAHESLKKMKPRAPKNFREADICDKIARRNAGLDDVDSAKQVTLIHINEAIDAYDQPIELHPNRATLTPCLTDQG